MAPQRETSQEKEPPPLAGETFLPESELFPSGTDSLPSGRRTHGPPIIVLPEVSPDWESLFPSEEPAPGMFRVEPPSPKWSRPGPSAPPPLLTRLELVQLTAAGAFAGAPGRPAPPPLLTRLELVQLTASGAFAVVSLVFLMSVLMKPASLPATGVD